MLPSCHAKNPNRCIPACILGELKRCNNEDGTDKTFAIDKRIKDKCDEKANEWTDNALELSAYLTVRATELHAADAYYYKDGSSADDLSQVMPRKKHQVTSLVVL